ncbi:MAG: helicase-related protein [Sandaracinaceae bacterium]|nr:helicase-related protein [Sandaracinaceae bacterium]
MECKLPRVLEGPFWPEKVRVLNLTPVGDFLEIDAVGVEHGRFYERMLSRDEVDQLAKKFSQEEKEKDFKGNPSLFRLGVEAHFIESSMHFDSCPALGASAIDPLPHQITAVYRFLLPRPRIRFLLADDPGAGKTIMAGLLFKELKLRGVVERVLIVVPGYLKDQWKRELEERFQEDFKIVDRQALNAFSALQIWKENNQVIVSIDFAKQESIMPTLSGVNWDLVIVDEAHKMAAYRHGSKTEKTNRYRLGELLAQNTEHLLLLTATPHRGDQENFKMLLRLIEPGLFDEEASALPQDGVSPFFLRRLKEELRDFEGKPLFPLRHVVTRTYRLSEIEKRLHEDVTEYVRNGYTVALSAKRRNVAFAMLILQRRLASSVRAVRRSLERRKERLSKMLERGEWSTEEVVIDEEDLEDAPEAERFEKEEELVASLTNARSREELENEIGMLKRLIELAKEAEGQECEAKLKELRQVMEDERIREQGEKLLIFTESRDTLEYLVEKLSAWGYKVTTIHGKMKTEERIASERRFKNETQVMVSTEAGGEGINLQFCSLMVNYDIPWNPNRLEQRMGRIHRYGQKKAVHIYNLVAENTREGMVLSTLFEKLNEIREALGSDRVFDVIGEIVPGRSLRDLIIQAISEPQSLDEIRAKFRLSHEEVQRIREDASRALESQSIALRAPVEKDLREKSLLRQEEIHRFLEEAFAHLGVATEVIKKGDSILRIPKRVYESFGIQSETGKKEWVEVALDRASAIREGVELVGPGHPLLVEVTKRVLREAKPHLDCGAIFVDPSGCLDGWLWFFQAEMRDGRDKVMERSVIPILQKSDGSFEALRESILRELVPASEGPEVSHPPSFEGALAFLLGNVLEPRRTLLLEERRHWADLMREHGLRFLEVQILDADARCIEYQLLEMQGKPVSRAEFQREEARHRRLLARKRELQAQIEGARGLAWIRPEPIALARVFPQIKVSKAELKDEMSPSSEIEAEGMRVALEYERKEGRFPEDVSSQNLGYDIVSRDPSGSIRYIEVKARAKEGAIELTHNEWCKAQELGEKYWLYVIAWAAKEPKLYPIQNPSQVVSAEEEEVVIRTKHYRVRDWKKAAKPE